MKCITANLSEGLLPRFSSQFDTFQQKVGWCINLGVLHEENNWPLEWQLSGSLTDSVEFSFHGAQPVSDLACEGLGKVAAKVKVDPATTWDSLSGMGEWLTSIQMCHVMCNETCQVMT